MPHRVTYVGSGLDLSDRVKKKIQIFKSEPKFSSKQRRKKPILNIFPSVEAAKDRFLMEKVLLTLIENSRTEVEDDVHVSF